MRNRLDDIRSLHNQLLYKVIQQADRKSIQTQIDDLVNENYSRARDLRERFQSLQPRSSTCADPVIKANGLDCMRRFQDALALFRDLQTDMQLAERKQAEQRIRMVYPEASVVQIETMLNETQSDAAIFSEHILESSRYQEANRVLSEVQHRHSQVQALAKNVIQLQAMFEDMAFMVNSQHDTVIHVSDMMQDVEMNTEQATQELNKAVKSARSARAKKWCVLTFILAVVIAVCLYFVITAAMKAAANRVNQ